MVIRDCGSYQFVKYDSLDFIAGNRLFRYTMEVTGPHYILAIKSQYVYVYVSMCVRVCV